VHRPDDKRSGGIAQPDHLLPGALDLDDLGGRNATLDRYPNLLARLDLHDIALQAIVIERGSSGRPAVVQVTPMPHRWHSIT
jgi:hypothetical protein